MAALRFSDGDGLSVVAATAMAGLVFQVVVMGDFAQMVV